MKAIVDQYHILNGDALYDFFPKDILGEKIIARECLIEGPVGEENIDNFFSARAQFIAACYPNLASNEYAEHVVKEFEKIKAIKEDSEVNLWFEEDLFCQCNCWFVIELLVHFGKTNPTYLIMPKAPNQFSFASLNDAELQEVYRNKMKLSQPFLWIKLWRSYQKKDVRIMKQLANRMSSEYPFILRAVDAYIESLPSGDSRGKPLDELKKIKKELPNASFGEIYKVFTNRIPIYGFGDDQVRRLLEQL